MGTKSFLISVLVIFTLLAFIIPKKQQSNTTLKAPIAYDSLTLKKYNVYICEGHFFEWCKEPSVCPYCNEKLTPINLWDYYKKLECEDCKKYFEENYRTFSKSDESQ